MARISSTHHVFGIPHLLCELRDGERTVLLRATSSQGCKTNHEEVESWERDEVHSELSEVGIELAGEAKAACNSTHGCGNQVVEITN